MARRKEGGGKREDGQGGREEGERWENGERAELISGHYPLKPEKSRELSLDSCTS